MVSLGVDIGEYVHPTMFGQATAVKKSREIEMVAFLKRQGALE